MRRIIASILISLSIATATAQINTDQVVQIGRNAMYFEDYVLAIQYFNQVIAAKPYLAQPYFFRGIAKFNLEDYQGAIDDATTAIDHNPFITDAYELRGAALQNLGKLSQAVDDYNKVLEMLPENRSIIYNKAMAQIELKEYDAARQSFDDLVKKHPRFDAGRLGRARLNLITGDTLSASCDIDSALIFNKNAVNAYIMRADIAINGSKDYEKALADMDEAIKLQPKVPGFFINRAFLRHQLNDYYGAMSDYDYALQLDPLNTMAIYNRALLRMEIQDFDHAIEDLNKVLAINSNDYRALYNRAIVNKELGRYKNALADANNVIEAFPSLAAAYFLRFDIRRAMGDRNAMKDYDKSIALARQSVKADPLDKSVGTKQLIEKSESEINGEEPQEVVSARFSQLLTITDNSNPEQEYNNKSIRGRIQDHNTSVEIEPMFVASYYTSPTELKPSSDYMKEVDELNKSHTLHFVLQVTNHEPSLTDEQEIKKHFESIDYYNSYIATHTPRAVDLFGRGMDQLTLHNYKGAILDFNRAIEIAPDFALGYLMRSIATYRDLSTAIANPESGQSHPELKRGALQSVIADIDKVIKLSPNSPIAWFNKGVVLTELQDYTSALAAFSKAIELKPEFGEAYFNRGFVYFRLGNRASGASDLSKAGELGIVPSYNLLKRMNR